MVPGASISPARTLQELPLTRDTSVGSSSRVKTKKVIDTSATIIVNYNSAEHRKGPSEVDRDTT